jgi:hypothetical protein
VFNTRKIRELTRFVSLCVCGLSQLRAAAHLRAAVDLSTVVTPLPTAVT